MLDNNKWSQYGQEGIDVQGIVLHNTNEYDMNAQEIFDYLNGGCVLSTGTHFLVDSNGVIEVMPLTWKTWSSGKGNDWCFDHCIAIEICSNRNDELYEQGQNKAIALIKELMNTYNLNSSQIYGHIDFNNRFYCPATILQKYGSVQRFVIEKIESED